MNADKLALLAAALVLTACGAASNQAPRVAQPAAAPAPAAPRVDTAPVGGFASSGAPASGADATGSATVSERMVIQVATLSMVVKDVDAALPQAHRVATDLGGYVQTSNVARLETGSTAKFVLKVPSASLDKALASLRALAVEMREENISGQDVTAEFTDLDAQVRNLESAEAQLRQIMAKTDKPEDVLKVFNELTRVRGEIERLKGRMNLLSRSSEMATINVTMLPTALPTKPAPLPSAWDPGRTLGDAARALLGDLQQLGSGMIWVLVYYVPILIAVLAFIALLVALVVLPLRAIRKLTRRSKPAPVGEAPAKAPPA